MAQVVKPSREQLEAARGRVVADVIASDLVVLFCGINPGLYSGATGHHFARPGNRSPLCSAVYPRVHPFRSKALDSLREDCVSNEQRGGLREN